MYKVLLLVLVIAFGCAKKPAEDKKPDVFSLREMSDLATVEYTITKIIKASDDKTWFKVGDRKILMSCEATIKAGVDMSGIMKENFSTNGKAIHLRLPPPKIISINIPAEKIKTEYQEVSVFRDPYKTGERDNLAAQAEAQIARSIPQLGILDQAKANTTLFVHQFLRQIGYDNITISFDAPPTNTSSS